MVCHVLCLSFMHFKPTFRLSEFKLFRCFSICFAVSLKRATSSANLKLVRFSPSTLTPSEMSAFLNTSSMTAVNNLGESGSPCLTSLCIGNSVDTSLSRWTLAVAWLYMFCRMFMYVSFTSIFLNASKIAKCSTVSKAFSYSMKSMQSGKLHSFHFSII